MKTLKLIITAVCVSILALFLLGAECGVPVETGYSLPPYYIMFKVDGVSKIFDKGFTDFESNAFAGMSGGTQTAFFATAEVISSFDNRMNYIEIFLNGISEGAYSDAVIDYHEEGILYLTNTGSLTITKYEDVGGVIEGTFSGTVEGKVITEGKFKVKRLPNDIWD